MQGIKRRIDALLSRLVAINSLAVLIVILLAGYSLNQYACYLVNSEEVTGQDLVRKLDAFLVFSGILAFLAAGGFHYFSAKRIVAPLKSISRAAKELEQGRLPSSLPPKGTGEIKELITSFNSMAGKLKESQQEREEMLKDIAHELRTPLTNINGYLEALKNGVIDGSPGLFGSLLEESERITRIAERLTELQSWQPGSIAGNKHFESLRLDEILKESLSTFQLKLEANFSIIDIRLEPAVVFGNKDGLKQVFTNILQNVIDYNLGNKIGISLSTASGTADISFSHTGQPISPEKKELIFERFYRLEESRSTKAEGAGLGLAIAKSIILAHKGEIILETDGSHHVFQIKLPLGTDN